MSTEENKANARRFYEEVWNQGNVAALNELMSPSAVAHQLPPGVPSGISGFKLYVKAYRVVFPDAHFAVEDLIAEGDKVVVRWTMTGTHKGRLPFLPGMHPTGKRVTLRGLTLLRYGAAGKIAESWANTDPLGLMRQVGTLPIPA
jgi:predicted ester cyclase